MSGWLDMWAPTGNLLRSFLSSESNPNKVLEVKQGQYSDRIIKGRGEGIVLYGPSASYNKNEIVMNRPTSESLHQGFSLFRSEDDEAVEAKFILLKDIIPVIVDVAKELCNSGMLQKMCDTMETHPGWTVAHLAAHFDLYSTFSSERISRFINSSDPHTGLSPLLVAIQAQNLQTIKVLVAQKASLEHLDHEANSVFHYAASTNKDIISALSADSQLKCLNYRNVNGHTPLHMACLADKPECVKALLLAGADCNISADSGNFFGSPSETTQPGIVGSFVQENPKKLYAQDMKYGGTPLHWSCSKEVIEPLLDMGCHIDSLNFDRRSALHIMVMRKRLECVMALLCRGADLNIGDCDGNSPLHLAVTSLNIPIIQGLIVFGANLNFKNNQGASPRHVIRFDSSNEANRILYILHAVGAPRCPFDMNNCSPGCAYNDTFDGIAPATPPAASTREAVDQLLSTAGMNLAVTKKSSGNVKRCHALCLDGGGIRGLIIIVMLLELEHAVGKPILKCFDWVAGTSTGGILALGLAVGKSLRDCLRLYFRMKDITFVGKRPYANEPLEKLLKDCMGPTTVMSDIVHPKLMITGLLADRKPVDLHLFRNYLSPSQLLGVDDYATCSFVKPPMPDKQYLWEAARASGAAPYYFKAFGRFLDGGLIANNPTLDCLTEIHEYNLALKALGMDSEYAPVTVVVSLGTGNIPVSVLKEIDVAFPDSIWNATKLVAGIAQLGTLIVDQATQSTGRVVDRARAWCSMIGVPFYRFSPPLSEDINMDERSDEKLVNMVWECQAYMYSQRSLVHELAALLRE